MDTIPTAALQDMRTCPSRTATHTLW